jgi:arylsulfatase A-like enzyme
MNKRCHRLTLASCLFLAIACLTCSTTEDSHRPNVVLVIVDALRPDHLGCYGYHRATSPVMDSLADSGILFEDAVAQAPWTKTSFSSFLTSLYPFQHGVVGWESVMPDSIVTLQEVLGSGGYTTIAVVNMLGITDRFEVLKGFDEVSAAAKYKRNAAQTTADAVELMRSVPQPFFALVHYFDVHWPYRPPIRYVDMIQQGVAVDPFGEGRVGSRVGERPSDAAIERAELLYDSCIRFSDDGIGGIVGFLEETGIRERTLIIITADHGEAFWEHGFGSHGHSTHQEEIRVPLIFNCPGVYGKPSRVTDPVALVDLVPTIVELAGVSDDHHREGRNLDLLIREGRSERSLSESFLPADLELSESTLAKSPGSKCIRSARWKLMLEPATSLVRLYDLEHDPGELESVWGRVGTIGDSLLAHAWRVPGSRVNGWRLGFTGDGSGPAYEVDVQMEDGARLILLERLVAGGDLSIDIDEDSSSFHVSVVPLKQQILLFDIDPQDAGIRVKIAGGREVTAAVQSGVGEALPMDTALRLTPDRAMGLPEAFDAGRTLEEEGAYLWWLPGGKTGKAAPATELTPEEKQRLRALGYIQ